MKLSKQGLRQAISVVVYCASVGLLIYNGNQIFGKTPNYFGPVAFLLLFSTSVLVCGLLVFYKPYKLFFAKKQTQAIDLVVSTTVWLFIFFIVFLLLALGLR